MYTGLLLQLLVRNTHKLIYYLRYCFLLKKDCVRNEVWGCPETLPIWFITDHDALTSEVLVHP